MLLRGPDTKKHYYFSARLVWGQPNDIMFQNVVEKVRAHQPASTVFSSLLNHLSRRFSSGRLVVNKDFDEENPWINNSEFGCAGRPLTENKILLPLSRELLLPEALDPDNDLRFAERTRPSVEAASAQKGQQRWLTMFRSLLAMTSYSLKNKPVIIVNLTSYVEDVGVAVTCLSLA